MGTDKRHSFIRCATRSRNLERSCSDGAHPGSRQEFNVRGAAFRAAVGNKRGVRLGPQNQRTIQRTIIAE